MLSCCWTFFADRSWYDQTLQADQYAMDRYVWRSIGRQDLLGDVSDDETTDSYSDSV